MDGFPLKAANNCDGLRACKISCNITDGLLDVENSTGWGLMETPESFLCIFPLAFDSETGSNACRLSSIVLGKCWIANGEIGSGCCELLWPQFVQEGASDPRLCVSLPDEFDFRIIGFGNCPFVNASLEYNFKKFEKKKTLFIQQIVLYIYLSESHIYVWNAHKFLEANLLILLKYIVWWTKGLCLMIETVK